MDFRQCGPNVQPEAWFFVKNIVTIEFDVQAGTATVVRPEGGKA
jgi:hypothetical protein